MRTNSNFTVRLLLAAMIVLAGRCCGIADELPTGSRSVAGKVLVTLRSRVAVDTDVIHVSDVAMVSGGDAALREQIKSLDVEEAVVPGEALTITPTQIEFRLQLAGVSLKDVAVRGSAVRVTSPTVIKKVSAIATRSPASEPNESPLSANATQPKPVAPTKGTAVRSLPTSKADEKTILVKRNDRVRLVAKTGAVSIVTVGEAQQDGREGETIRVLNASSKTQIKGRVTGVNEVEISF